MREYSTEIEISTRYRDIDSLGHVNNAVYTTYLEQARVEYMYDVLSLGTSEPDFVIVNLEINFEREVTTEESVVVRLSVTDIGSASITMEYEILADAERVSTARSVIVPYDGDAGQSMPVPDEWRERISAHEGRDL